MIKLKLDANGQVVTVKEGDNVLPVYVHDDGSEKPFDANSTVATITRLNHENQTVRKAKETAEAALKPFVDAGIADPVAAAKALSIVKNLDDKKLVDANQVEQIKQEAIKAIEEKYAPVVKERDTLQASLYNEKIGGAFARSPMIVGEKAKLAIPADIAQARFGQQFKIEDGRVVAYDGNGNKIFSRVRPGELADFDEALDVIVDAYPQKASILKGSGASGGGAGGSGGGQGGGKSMSRAQFEALDPMARSAAVKAGTAVHD